MIPPLLPLNVGDSLAKLNAWVSVTQPSFAGGVPTDGVSDCQPAVQAAVTYALSLISVTGTGKDKCVGVFLPSCYRYFFGAPVLVPGGHITIYSDGQAFIFGDCILFDIGDYTNALRVPNVTLANLVLASSNTANTTAGVKLYRCTSPKLLGCTTVNFDVHVDCYHVSTPTISGHKWQNNSRTVSGHAALRMQGLDETLFPIPNNYTPGGGMHLGPCEFALSSGTVDTIAGIELQSCDGFYWQSCHFTGAQYSMWVNPQATPANHVISDIRGGSGGSYFDEPATNIANAFCAYVAGHVSGNITMADGSTVKSSYQSVEFDGTLFRGANVAINTFRAHVLDDNADSFVGGGGTIPGVKILGGESRKAVSTGIVAYGTGDGAHIVELTGFEVMGVATSGHNYGNVATISDISVQCESASIVDNVGGPAANATQYSITALLSLANSNAPSAVIAGNNFAAAPVTVSTLQISALAGPRLRVADNLEYGAGGTIARDAKISTPAEFQAAIIWQRTIGSTGEVAKVAVDVVGSNADASARASFHATLSAYRQSAGTAAVTSLAISEAVNGIPGGAYPVIVDLMTGYSWSNGAAAPVPSSATASGSFFFKTTDSNLYLVVTGGNFGATKPTHTTGFAANGTAVVAYVGPVAANAVGVVVVGASPADTALSYMASVDWKAIP